MTTTTNPRIAILSDLSEPPYNEVTETRCVPWGEAVKMLNAYRAAVLREAADRYQGFIDNADTGADPRYWTGIRDMVIGLRHLAVEQPQGEEA